MPKLLYLRSKQKGEASTLVEAFLHGMRMAVKPFICHNLDVNTFVFYYLTVLEFAKAHILNPLTAKTQKKNSIFVQHG